MGNRVKCKLGRRAWIIWITTGVVLMTAGISQALCPENIIAYWKLEDATYADETGMVPDGACGSCPTQTPDAVVGDGQSFDGVTNNLTIPHDSAFDWGAGDSFSVEFWMKTSSIQADRAVAIGRVDLSNSLEWWVGIDDDGYATASLVARDGSGTGKDVSDNTDIRDNIWHHIAFVRDGKTDENRLYVDGSNVDSRFANYSANFRSPDADIDLGWMDAGGGFHFEGKLDEIAVQGFALSDTQVLQHYLDGSIGLQWGYCSVDSTIPIMAGDSTIRVLAGESPIRIMALGDSITFGSGGGILQEDAVGFRQKLYLDLRDWDWVGAIDPDRITFVGDNISGWNAVPAFDIFHEGYGGVDSAYIESIVYDSLTDYPADVVLLHIGTNDMDPVSPNIPAAVANVNDILDEIDRYSEDVTVVLARIINRQIEDADTTAFNSSLQTMADARIASGDKLVVVDQESALNYPGDMIDNEHPITPGNPITLEGYNKMAEVWYSALIGFLPPTNVALPEIVSTAKTKAYLNKLYTYDVDATGNEEPTYSLIQKPAGMVIDEIGGLITWTPSATGTQDITVRAANPAGIDTQNFTISIDKEPPSDNSGSGGSLCFVQMLDSHHPTRILFAEMTYGMFALFICVVLSAAGIISYCHRDA